VECKQRAEFKQHEGAQFKVAERVERAAKAAKCWTTENDATIVSMIVGGSSYAKISLAMEKRSQKKGHQKQVEKIEGIICHHQATSAQSRDWRVTLISNTKAICEVEIDHMAKEWIGV
jgi:hypothetical protein